MGSNPKYTGGKTPFEIRLECLRMAQEQMNQSYYAKHDALSSLSAIDQSAKAELSNLNYPDQESIIALGNQFYGFVADTSTDVVTRNKNAQTYTRTSHTKEKNDEQEK